MQGIVFILTCVDLCTTYAAHLKLYKTENREVKEFQMDRGDTLPKMLLNDFGNFTNCGDKSYKCQVQWSPFILSTQGMVTFYWDIVAPNDWTRGTIHFEVFLPDDPQSILFSLDHEVTCAQVKGLLPPLNCPVKREDEIKGQTTISDLTIVPTGKYGIEMKMTDDKNLIIICSRGIVEIIE